MRISIIACRVLGRELSALAATAENTIDLHWLPQGLHDVPAALRERIQRTINEIQDDVNNKYAKLPPDYIALGYGLCSNGVIGLESRDIPLIIPRTDDCIALFLGSQKTYLEHFQHMNGAYWLNNGWVESCGALVDMERKVRQRWQEYAEKFGEDNADYLIGLESQWLHHYDSCGYIKSEVYESPAYQQMAQQIAAEHGWQFKMVDGNLRILRMLVSGLWNQEEFLICPPCHRVTADYSGAKMRAEPIVQGGRT